MNSNNTKTNVLRISNTEDIKTVWEGIRNIRIQKQIAVLDKLIKNLSRDKNINDEAAKRMILNVEHDGLIERCSAPAVGITSPTIVSGTFNNEFFNLPDFSKKCIKGPHDWNCFSCHLAGEVISCNECFRSYHLTCYKELSPRHSASRSHNRLLKSGDKFCCQTCESKSESEEIYSRKLVRKLLDFATHFIRKKSVWKDMATIGFRGEIAKNEYLVHRYLDLELIQKKIKDGRYTALHDLIDDAEIFMHDVCILHGIFTDKADQARVLLREIKNEISEVKLCADCYINAKAKLAEWITKPCKPSHKLIWSKQTGAPGGQYYWPAKILVERSDGFEVRFFGGIHDRAFVEKSDTKSFNFRPEEVETKSGSGFDRAWNEVGKLREKIEQGYYTQSSGESDLPPTEDEYSDEIYLSERREAGLTLSDNHLTNGSTYPLFGSLSSRRSFVLDRTRKSAESPPANEQVSSKKPGPPSIKPKAPKRTSSRSGGPLPKKRLSSNNAEKSNSSNVKSEKSTSLGSTKKEKKNCETDTDSIDESDDDSDNSSSSSSSSSSSPSSVNMKSINYKFSPKNSNTRSRIAAAKGLRQNRKPSIKMCHLSTDSSEFDPKMERTSHLKRRPRKKARYKGASKLLSIIKLPCSPIRNVLDPIAPKSSPKCEEMRSNDEDTDKCCSPDRLSTTQINRGGPNQKVCRPLLRRGIAAADSTSNNAGSARPANLAPVVTTTTSYSNRQRIHSGYNSVIVNQPKIMLNKCVWTTMPVCNCEEKFKKKLVEEKQKLSKDYSQVLMDLELKLRTEFEESKSVELKTTTEEIRLQMQELIDKEKVASQEALNSAEARQIEALTNTKKRQWCRNCLKEAIYHCCWNTSYCSIQCQQEHWQKEHKRVCRRKR